MSQGLEVLPGFVVQPFCLHTGLAQGVGAESPEVVPRGCLTEGFKASRDSGSLSCPVSSPQVAEAQHSWSLPAICVSLASPFHSLLQAGMEVPELASAFPTSVPALALCSGAPSTHRAASPALVPSSFLAASLLPGSSSVPHGALMGSPP